MAKAIFSLFCVAALFSSGLVSAFDENKLSALCKQVTDKAGDGVTALGDYVKTLTGPGKDAFDKYFEVGEGNAESFADTLLQGLTGAGAKLGDAEIDKLCGKVGLGESENTPNNNNGGGNNNNGGGNNNNGGGNNNNGGGNNNDEGENNINSAVYGDTNGGNTVQVSILGMFIILVLAIFNH